MEGDFDRVLDPKMVESAIKGVCDVYDGLGLTLSERFYASHCVAVSAAAMLGEKYSDLAAMIEEKHPEWAEKAREQEEKPAE